MENSQEKKPTILVVDDEVDIRLAISDLLQNEGYQVEMAGTGIEALNRLSPTHPYSAVILDLGLPDIEGLRVLQQIQIKDHTLPVIILTAHGDQKDKLVTLQHHAFAHVVKPYDRQEVLEMVHRAVGIQHLKLKAVQVEQALTSSEAQRQREQQRHQMLLSASEQRLRLVLESTSSGFWDWDLETGYVHYSPHWIESLGYDPDQITYTVDFWQSLLHPDDRSHTHAALTNHLEGQTEVYECENRLRLASGGWRWNRVRGKIVERNPEGKALRIVGTDTDISELKMAQRTIQVLQHREEMLLKSAAEGFLGLDREGKLMFVNDAAAGMLGWDSHDLIGQPCSDTLYPRTEDSPSSKERFAFVRTLKEGTSHSIDSEVFWKKNGTSFPVEYTSTPLKDQEGNVSGAVVTFRDISQRRRTEEMLRKGEQKFRAIYDQAPIGIAIINSISGDFNDINQKYCEIVGYSKEDMLTLRFQDITHPEDLQPDLDNMTRLLAGDVSLFKMEKRYTRKDGKVIWVNLTCVRLWLERTDPRLHMAIVEDITERKEFEQRLEERRNELEKVNLELDRFVYTASHDLRTPLRGIEVFASFLEEDYTERLDDQGKAYIEEIRKGVNQMSTLIEDLLTLSQISRIHHPYEDVDINKLVRDVLDRLHPALSGKELELLIQPNLPVVYCDRIKMRQVFLNLFSNAFKFSGKQEKPRVEFRYEEEPAQHKFWICDNGIGIDPRYHDQIFQLFERLNKQDEYEGTGAGLYIVMRIVEEHGGKIWVDSALGKGTTFYLTVPKALMKGL